jgi:UDP-glucose 4-epimerase
MMLICAPQPAADACLFTLWGSGLIGSAVASGLRARLPCNGEIYPVNWCDRVDQTRQLEVIERRITEVVRIIEAKRLAFCWCAGRVGFAATEDETQPELDSFRRVLAMFERWTQRHPELSASFHMVSSAGGLFERQRLVTADSEPAPHRPYGWLKWRQEQSLQSVSSPFLKFIYRPTSVYGPFGHNQRRGLVATLIANGLRQHLPAFYEYLRLYDDAS